MDIPFIVGVNLFAHSELSCNCIEDVEHDLVALLFGWLIFFSRSGLPALSRHWEWDPHDPWDWFPMIYYFRFPSWINRSISFLSWEQSYVWCHFTLWNLHQLNDSYPISSTSEDEGAEIWYKWNLSPNMFALSVRGHEALHLLSYYLRSGFSLMGEVYFNFLGCCELSELGHVLLRAIPFPRHCSLRILCSIPPLWPFLLTRILAIRRENHWIFPLLDRYEIPP